jgi:hypothetical protein
MTDIPNYVEMFPEPSDVFADKIEEHSKYLFPLFSVDLNAINPSWNGKVFMVQFNEDPYNQSTVETFNEFCKDCMIAFDVIDGKYSFTTDFKYFDLTPDWNKWFEKTKTTFYHSKEYFRQNGRLPDKSYGGSGDIYEQLGGEPEWIQGGSAPIDPEGNPMTFIARVYTSNYTQDSCPKDLYLFYSDECKLAVLLYQIT